MPDEKYTQQIIKAKETLGILENELHQIRLKLRNSPTDTEYLKELKRITLEVCQHFQNHIKLKVYTNSYVMCL